MNKKTSLTIVIIVTVALVGVAAFALISNKNSNTPEPANQSATTDDRMANMGNENPGPNQSDANKSAAADKVKIENFAYSPSAVTVKVGTTVTWTNNDNVGHTVTSDEGIANGPSSELLGKGESYSFTFTKAGTYTYFCQPHPYMKGAVTVTE